MVCANVGQSEMEGVLMSNGSQHSANAGNRRSNNLPTVGALLVTGIIIGQVVELSPSLNQWATSRLWLVPQLLWGGLFGLIGRELVAVRKTSGRNATLAYSFLYAVIPVLIVIGLTMIVIGPLASSDGPSDYFRDIRSWSYLTNVIGLPQVDLPGVFEFSFVSDVVNATVWAIPCFYLLVIAALVGGGDRLKTRIVGGAIGLAIIAAEIFGWFGAFWPDRLSINPAATLVAGLMGMILYHIVVPRRAILSLCLCICLGVVGLMIRAQWPSELLIAQEMLAATIGGALAILAASRGGRPKAFAQFLLPVLSPALLASFPLQQLLATNRSVENGFVFSLLAAILPIAIVSLSITYVISLAARRLGYVHQDPTRASFGMPDRHKARHLLRTLRWDLAGLIALLVCVLLFALAMALFALSRPVLAN